MTQEREEELFNRLAEIDSKMNRLIAGFSEYRNATDSRLDVLEGSDEWPRYTAGVGK